MLPDTVARYLGSSARPLMLRTGAGAVAAWSAPATLDEQEDVVAAARTLRATGTRLFLSDGGRAKWLLMNVPTLDVIALAEVGTHAADGEGWQEVREVLGRIFERAPFDIVFADSAGLLAVFHETPSFEDAAEFANALMEAGWLDSVVAMAEEDGDVDDPMESAAAYIAHGRLRLWWD